MSKEPFCAWWTMGLQWEVRCQAVSEVRPQAQTSGQATIDVLFPLEVTEGEGEEMSSR